MKLNQQDLELLVEALDKKIWSLHHVGLSSGHPRVAAFEEIRRRMRDRQSRGGD